MLIASAVAWLGGCEPQAPLPPPATGASASVQSISRGAAGTPTSLVIVNKTLTVIQPVALRPIGQSDLRGGPLDTLPFPAQLLTQLGAAEDGAAKGDITIQAVAPVGDGRVLLYAGGIARYRSLVSLWIFDPSNARLTLLADSDGLANVSGLGQSVDLAEARMLATPRGIWLCLSQMQATAFFLFPIGQPPSGRNDLHRAFSQLREDGHPFPMLRDDRLYARADGGLGLLRADGGVFSISDGGSVHEMPADLPSATGRPPWSAPPLYLPARAAADLTAESAVVRLEFCPNASDSASALPSALPPAVGETPIRYPAFILSGPHGKTVIDRDAIAMRPGFPVHALHITAWCLEPNSGDVIAYDAMSGEILRITLPNRAGRRLRLVSGRS